MNEIKPSILITGANGFVGARLCRQFLNEGFTVYAGVRQSADLSNLAGLDLQFRYGDVTHLDSLPPMVAEIDYVIHNAGIVKAKSNHTFFDVNDSGTKNLLEAIEAHNPNLKKFIYISSQAAAGPSLDHQAVTEACEPHPLTTYGKSKLAGERTTLSYADRINVLSIRPPGVYGPGDKEIFGFFQTLHHRIKPYIGNTSRKLQLVHVDDLCRGIFMAMTASTNSGNIYFIAENRAYSMKELVNILRNVIGRSGLPLYIPGSLFKVIAGLSEVLFRLVGATPMLTREKAKELLASWEISVEKAKQDFGYESQISFEAGAKTTYQWYKQEGWL